MGVENNIQEVLLTIVRFNKVVAAAFPKIMKINWGNHGSGDTMRGFDSRGPLRAGMLSHYQISDEPILGINTQQHGFLLNPALSGKIIAKKFGVVSCDDATIFASMQRRDPRDGVYSGVIQSDIGVHNAILSAGVTGVPEIGDHLTSANILRRDKFLSEERYAQVIQPDFPGMAEAKAEAGMTDEQFADLESTISRIVAAAHKQVLDEERLST